MLSYITCLLIMLKQHQFHCKSKEKQFNDRVASLLYHKTFYTNVMLVVYVDKYLLYYIVKHQLAHRYAPGDRFCQFPVGCENIFTNRLEVFL